MSNRSQKKSNSRTSIKSRISPNKTPSKSSRTSSKTQIKLSKLHGIVQFVELVKIDEDANGPNKVYLIGEKHGHQTCGNTDYISFYKNLFKKHEDISYFLTENDREPQYIDMFIEEFSIMYIHDYDTLKKTDGWLVQLRKYYSLGL